MTQRLYYDDAYLKEFEAQVLEVNAGADGFHVRLDRSAFYPTSGGQTHDTGALGGTNVLSVYVSATGEVWHVLDAPLVPGADVEGRIDWARRFDHMQQHAGEHMLAGEIYKKYAGETIGLHLGAEVSTIDVNMPGGAVRISDGEIARLEDGVNEQIQADLGIRCWFPDAAELKTLTLRKPPAVLEHIRIVKIGEDELVACGGTHPSSTGQIGMLKIIDVRPSKGKMRVSFLCGMRAFRALREHFDASARAAELLSAQAASLPEAVLRIKERERDMRAEIIRLSRENAFSRLQGVEPKRLSDNTRLYNLSFSGLDDRSLREIAVKLVSEGPAVALLEAVSEDARLLVFARSEGVLTNMGALLSECARAHGGKGGGKAEFAQGSAKTEGALSMAEAKMGAIV